MKKFIAPEVRVVRYDSSSLCTTSIGVGEDYNDGDGDNYFDAPRRRTSIFEDKATDLEDKKGLK